MERCVGDFPDPQVRACHNAPIHIFTPSGIQTQAIFTTQLFKNVSCHIILAPPHPASPAAAMALIEALESRHPHPLPTYLIFDADSPPNGDLVYTGLTNISPSSPCIIYSKLAHDYLVKLGGFDENLTSTKLFYMNSHSNGSLRHGVSLDVAGSTSHNILQLWKSGTVPCVTLRLESLPGGVKDLVEAAEAARRDKARARKSGYIVGAAVRDLKGNVATAGNLERSATSTSLCAETFAILKADGDNGEKMIREIAVVGFPKEWGIQMECFTMPCGRCLQVMKESCPMGEEVLVYVMSLVGRRVRLTTLGHLLSMPYVSLKNQIAILKKSDVTNGTVEMADSGAVLENGVNGGWFKKENGL